MTDSDSPDGDGEPGVDTDTGGDGEPGVDTETENGRTEQSATRAARERAGVAESASGDLPEAADRAERLAAYDFVSRLREADDTLVLYPAEWVEDGTVQTHRIGDTDRAHELTLSGPGDPEKWEQVETYNAEIVDRVAEQHGHPHRRNARAFADFVGNHYAKRVDAATAPEVEEFLTEYYPRNAWPSERQRAVVRDSVRYVFEAAETPSPL
jgi:hypothetical protein